MEYQPYARLRVFVVSMDYKLHLVYDGVRLMDCVRKIQRFI